MKCRGLISTGGTSTPVNPVRLKHAVSGNHHDLGLFGIGPNAAPRLPGQVGLYHVAWQVDTVDELAAARDALRAAGALKGESSHGATLSRYGVDPDSNEVEVQWMLRRAEWCCYEHEAPVERLDLAVEVSRWSGVSTSHELFTATWD